VIVGKRGPEKEYNYEKVILTICGLVRLRIGALILT
jgi:hypothetical protein